MLYSPIILGLIFDEIERLTDIGDSTVLSQLQERCYQISKFGEVICKHCFSKGVVIAESCFSLDVPLEPSAWL